MNIVKSQTENSIDVIVFNKKVNPSDALIEKLIEKKKYGIYVERYCSDVTSFYIQLDPEKEVYEEIRTHVAELVKLCHTEKVTNININTEQVHTEIKEDDILVTYSVVDGLHTGSYKFDRYKSEKKINELHVFIQTSFDYSPSHNLNIAQSFARDLVNTPGSDLTPKEYVNAVEDFFSVSNLKKYFNDVKLTDHGYLINDTDDVFVARDIIELDDSGTIEIEYLTTEALELKGYTGINAVGKGSDNGTAMVALTWRPNEAINSSHFAFVGKGVTFDTGGISLKPGDKMWEMKMDMGGSAASLGAFIATILNKTPTKVSSILCLAENRPGNNSLLPGDIFTAANGKTIMVDNTDAEGRLVLTDGLYHAGKIGASHVIDIATLTGAVVASLGDKIAGVFSDEPELVNSFIGLSEAVGEKYWQLPLATEYREGLDDECADICNMGGRPGAITAALFLKEFVPKEVKWMHVDIAGPAFCTSKWKYYGKGATGFGVKSLFAIPFYNITESDINNA